MANQRSYFSLKTPLACYEKSRLGARSSCQPCGTEATGDAKRCKIVIDRKSGETSRTHPRFMNAVCPGCSHSAEVR